MADGVVGLSDRECIVSSYSISTTQRNIHCHLYNRYTSEVTSTYNRFYTTLSEKKTLAQRELIYTQITSLTTSYSTSLSERSLECSGGYIVKSDERKSMYRRWYTISSNRYSHYAFTQSTERTIYQLCKWNSYRYGYAKSWHVSERYIATLGKLYTSYADQRYLYYQQHPSPTDIRKCYYEKCHFKFEFEITPNYNQLLPNIEISPSYQSLFENEIVNTYKLQFTYINIKDNLKDTDLAFVIWNPEKSKWIEIPLAMHAIVRIPLFNYGNTNTLFLNGFLVPISDLFYIALYPLCNKYTFKYDNQKCYEDVEEASRHGHIKLELLGKQYKWNSKMVIGNIKYQPISLKFYISKDFYINTSGGFNIRMLYGYPTKNTTHNTILRFMRL